jgi:hypothetical protein
VGGDLKASDSQVVSWQLLPHVWRRGGRKKPGSDSNYCAVPQRRGDTGKPDGTPSQVVGLTMALSCSIFTLEIFMSAKSTRPSGTCHLCGQICLLTEEHVPHKKAFNQGKTVSYGMIDWLERSRTGTFSRKGPVKQGGVKRSTLCEDCNQTFSKKEQEVSRV